MFANYHRTLAYLLSFSSISVMAVPAPPAAAVAPMGAAVTIAVSDGGSAYPRANYLNNGKIIGSYTAFPAGGQQVLTLVTSSDNGASWQFLGTAAQKPLSSGTLDNAFPIQLPSGRIILAYRNHSQNAAGADTIYRITMSSSDDEGVSWQFLCDAVVVDSTPTNNGVWEPFLRNAGDGSLQLYFSHEQSAVDQDSVILSSRDGGITWGPEMAMSGAREHASRDGMIGVAEMGGNNLLGVFETNDNSGPFRLDTVSSADGGATWSDRKTLYAAPEGKNAGAPQIARVGQTLVVSFMTNEDDPNAKLGTNWVDFADAKLLTSTDNGANWVKSTVFKAPAFWPGLTVLQDEKTFLYMAGSEGVVKSQTIGLA
ncbi:BgTH12-05937 [Blumeria graminis f. sp. triticale]|uniref:Bgt-5010 n=3 Tax=Blumeria graminis TaxID=34373 RepID=A0A061HLW6_BLUGR|nr:hypothetical protein BGT96224_5010 [Blumeria graminis f. sp. tritici 96224]CAD6504203.1 BgTH12-05937 [Blumeria graminis f. sp. triticale]VDB90996.1 Bgt-5010 [Blumeria graminis f. sp. tritici]